MECSFAVQIDTKRYHDIIEYYYSWKKYCNDEYRGRNRHHSEDVSALGCVCLARDSQSFHPPLLSSLFIILLSFSFPSPHTCFLYLFLPLFLPSLSLSLPSLHPLSSLPHRTTLMCVSSEQSPVPTRDVRQCYHTTNWSHTNKTVPSGE